MSTFLPNNVEFMGRNMQVRVDLRMDEELKRRIEEMAPRFGLRPSSYMRLAIIDRLDRDAAATAAMPKNQTAKPRK